MPHLPIRTSLLRPEVSLAFDIYLHISGKHLLYVKRSDSIEEDRLEKLKQKNVRQVYIDENDRAAYEQFVEAGIQAALNEASMPLKTRALIITGEATASLEEMFENPKPKENYERTQRAAANQVGLLLKHPEALEQILALARYDQSVYRHSVNVSAISIGLAARVGAPVQTCNALGLGGLLHDLGKSTQEPDSQQHPRIGAGLLLNKKYVSRDVLDIILMHEERLDGQGYPAGVKKIDQIFQVVGLANFYDRMVTLEGRDPKYAYETIAKMNPAPYDKRLIQGLKDVLVSNKIYR